MVVPRNRGIQIQTPKFNYPYYMDPKKVPIILGAQRFGVWSLGLRLQGLRLRVSGFGLQCYGFGLKV